MQITISKKVKVVVITLLMLFGIYDLWLREFSGNWDYRGYHLGHSIKLLLGAPDWKNGIKEPDAIASDIMHISQEKWDKPACKPRKTFDCTYLEKKRGEKCPLRREKEIAPLKECLEFSGVPGWKEPYCNRWNSKNCIKLEVYDYIYQRPDILKKIIEILERPCQYLPTEKELKEKGVESVSSAVDAARRAMRCDGDRKKPEIFIISVQDENWDIHSEIVVRRKE